MELVDSLDWYVFILVWMMFYYCNILKCLPNLHKSIFSKKIKKIDFTLYKLLTNVRQDVFISQKYQVQD